MPRSPLRMPSSKFILFSLALLFLLPLSACRKGSHTSDPRLRATDEMLSSHLPASTPLSRLVFYLNSQGFQIESSEDSQTIVALVRHVDPKTLQPVTARVTFYFDARGGLVSYDLVRVPDSVPRP